MMTVSENDIARMFRSARASGKAMDAFPGQQPSTLAEAYAIQDYEIDLAGRPQGWKVAAIKPELRETLGAERLVGPIIRLIDARSADGTIEIPVIEGGFAAVEAEFAIRIARDIPLSAEAYSQADLLASVAGLHIASEIAGSPLATLSDLGPTAVISDHGNNAAVVIGPEIRGWRHRALDALTARTLLNDAVVGDGNASRLPTGGPLGSLAFLVENLARRGRHLKAGDWVATGATTGVHRVVPGDHAFVDFGDDGRLMLQLAAQKRTD